MGVSADSRQSCCLCRVFLDVSGKPTLAARLACREEGERGKNWEECREKEESSYYSLGAYYVLALFFGSFTLISISPASVKKPMKFSILISIL